MIEGAVVISSKIFGGAIALLVAAALIITINPFLALFPIVGFIVNLVTRFKMEEIEYTWWLEFKKHLRKADYSKRVFYQPEFAKECKLTNVKEPLRLQFDEYCHSLRYPLISDILRSCSIKSPSAKWHPQTMPQTM